MVTPTPNKKDEGDSLQDKFKETFSNLKQGDKIDSLYKYTQEHTRDTVAYVILILGIILLFFKPWTGGALIGVVVGIYLYDEITSVLKNLNGFIEKEGMVRSLVLAGVALGFFISAPMIFVGAALGLGIKHLVGDTSK